MSHAPAQDHRFRLTGGLAQELAEAYGTPLYVVDEAHFRARVKAYLEAARAAYPKAEITFASKANSALALIAIAHQEGCLIDVASEGELRAAMTAGVPAAHCHLHGNNKSLAELRYALEAGVGQIVVDHFGELDMLAELGAKVDLVLRLAPGVDPVTHAKISTGQADTKFGFNIADGSADLATKKALDLGLNLKGYHCHVGSQLLDPEAQRAGAEFIASLAVEMSAKYGFKAEYLNIGGGLGVTYTAKDVPMPVAEYCKVVADAMLGVLEGSGLNPTIGQEPGRSLIGESGVTLYSVGVIKTVPARMRGHRTYVAVDGGLSDNPRPALYGSEYTVERVWPDGAAATQTVTVSGKHCETDMLFEDIDLPADLAAGDLLQVLVTGAYNASMASNYNRYPRPAMALLRCDGTHTLIQERDSWAEMFARERVPKDLLSQ